MISSSFNATFIVSTDCPSGRVPDRASTFSNLIPSGTGNLILFFPCRTFFIKRTQIGAAAPPPVKPWPERPIIGSLSSYPTQTEAEKSLVNPLNQASLELLVVPVFPAAGCLNPMRRTMFPVPPSTTPRIISNRGYMDFWGKRCTP